MHTICFLSIFWKREQQQVLILHVYTNELCPEHFFILLYSAFISQKSIQLLYSRHSNVLHALQFCITKYNLTISEFSWIMIYCISWHWPMLTFHCIRGILHLWLNIHYNIMHVIFLIGYICDLVLCLFGLNFSIKKKKVSFMHFIAPYLHFIVINCWCMPLNLIKHKYFWNKDINIHVSQLEDE